MQGREVLTMKNEGKMTTLLGSAQNGAPGRGLKTVGLPARGTGGGGMMTTVVSPMAVV